MPASGSAAGAAGLDQLKELQAAGLIDADTLKMIQSTMTNANAQLEQLHASGVMSDEVYAQAMASMAAATSGAGSSVDAEELDLLQHGESAPATVLALSQPPDETAPMLLIKLEVHPATGSPYEVDCAVSPAHPAAKLKVGDFLQVKVDPADRKHVAIDPT
jgi:D-serine deaminase-like pyridoxal phosphate-dependent protein